MPNHDKVLAEILKASDPEMQGHGAGSKGLNGLHAEVVAFLQEHYRVGTDLVLCPADGLGPGMGPMHQYESGDRVSVVFRHGFRRNPLLAAQALHQILEQGFHRPGTEVKAQRFDIRIRRLSGTRTLTLFVRPYLETGPGTYDPSSSEEESHFLLLHDKTSGAARRCNPLRHAQSLNRLGPYRDCLQLLRAWQQHEGFPLEGNALEMLVVNAANAPSAGTACTLTERMQHVLDHAVQVLQEDTPLMDLGTGAPCTDYLPAYDKTHLTERWESLRRALHGNGSKQVAVYFRI